MPNPKMIRFKENVHQKILLERVINPNFEKVQDVAEVATLKGLELIQKEREESQDCQINTK